MLSTATELTKLAPGKDAYLVAASASNIFPLASFVAKETANWKLGLISSTLPGVIPTYFL